MPEIATASGARRTARELRSAAADLREEHPAAALICETEARIAEDFAATEEAAQAEIARPGRPDRDSRVRYAVCSTRVPWTDRRAAAMAERIWMSSLHRSVEAACIAWRRMADRRHDAGADRRVLASDDMGGSYRPLDRAEQAELTLGARTAGS